MVMLNHWNITILITMQSQCYFHIQTYSGTLTVALLEFLSKCVFFIMQVPHSGSLSIREFGDLVLFVRGLIQVIAS